MFLSSGFISSFIFWSISIFIWSFVLHTFNKALNQNHCHRSWVCIFSNDTVCVDELPGHPHVPAGLVDEGEVEGDLPLQIHLIVRHALQGRRVVRERWAKKEEKLLSGCLNWKTGPFINVLDTREGEVFLNLKSQWHSRTRAKTQECIKKELADVCVLTSSFGAGIVSAFW